MCVCVCASLSYSVLVSESGVDRVDVVLDCGGLGLDELVEGKFPPHPPPPGSLPSSSSSCWHWVTSTTSTVYWLIYNWCSLFIPLGSLDRGLVMSCYFGR